MNTLAKYFDEHCSFASAGYEVGALQTLQVDPDVAARFPRFAELLRLARVTPIDFEFENRKTFFLEWESASGEPMAWLADRVTTSPNRIACEDHELLLRNFGGVSYFRLNEPENSPTLCAVNFLSESTTDGDFFQWLNTPEIEEAYQVRFSDLYCIAFYGGGEFVLCDRVTSRVWIHWPGTNYLETIRGITTFQEWVESLAEAWLKAMKKG
jgi:hypothetical protein